MPQLGIEPASSELHQPGTFERTLSWRSKNDWGLLVEINLCRNFVVIQLFENLRGNINPHSAFTLFVRQALLELFPGGADYIREKIFGRVQFWAPSELSVANKSA